MYQAFSYLLELHPKGKKKKKKKKPALLKLIFSLTYSILISNNYNISKSMNLK